MHALEDEWVGCEEQIENAVDEGHVDGEKRHDRLAKQQSHGPGEVLAHELPKVDLDFLLLRVDAPVQSPTTQLLGLADEDLRWIGLLEKEQVQNEGDAAHYGCQVHGPAPA